MARRAGTTPATKETSRRMTGTAMNVVGSKGLTPNNRLEIIRVKPKAASKPTTTPMP
jgi:hypothetical protein